RRRESAFTLLGGFRLDAAGRLDLKRVGLMPIFTVARVLAIRHRITARSTADRLRAFVARDPGMAATMEPAIEGQVVLLEAVLAQQLIDAEAGLPLTTRVSIARLDRPARDRLKKALKAVEAAVELVAEGHL